MAVVIRLKRTGRRNRPCYRISVADSRWPRDGRTLETLGLYDPIAHKAEAQHTLDVERARMWLARGATPSETVRSLFKQHAVFEGEHDLQAINERHRKQARRPGRKKVTKTRLRRKSEKAARATTKEARRRERLATKRATAKAGAAE